MQNSSTPFVSVGIMSNPTICVIFNQLYKNKNHTTSVSGKQELTLCDNKILFNGDLYDEILFECDEEHASFDLLDVTIGKEFHWQQKENQRFEGALKIIVEGNTLTAVNIIDVEKYLTSVISSEMKATSSIELLKAHAVISRSWLMAQIMKKQKNSQNSISKVVDNEIVKWYDHDDHKSFDVCADDHCQRYQGITKQTTNAVEQAIAETKGEILVYGNEICDARFSKACGGVSETYESCWDATPHPYLTKVVDNKLENDNDTNSLDLEEQAKRWILKGSKDSFCNTTSKRILSQVLNNYDQTTNDFYRWTQTYTQEEISKIIEAKSGYYFGNIIDIQPVERGQSGRIVRIKIVGSKLSMIVGKELEIRKWLSTSHLYSSAFIVERIFGEDNNIPTKFILKGAGWGHGVGLCQIGAAVMAEQGYNYTQILEHYYKNATLTENYGH